MGGNNVEEIIVQGEIGEDLVEQYRMVEQMKKEFDELLKTAKEKHKRIGFEISSFDVRLKQAYPECIDRPFVTEDNGTHLVIKFIEEPNIGQILRDILGKGE